MCTFDEICNVGNIPKLREETALNICAWKAEHEDVYAEFKKKMDNISVGDTSALESLPAPLPLQTYRKKTRSDIKIIYYSVFLLFPYAYSYPFF